MHGMPPMHPGVHAGLVLAMMLRVPDPSCRHADLAALVSAALPGAKVLRRSPAELAYT